MPTTLNGGAEPEFYVGYEPQAPPRLARLLGHAVIALAALTCAVAAIAIGGQGRFEPSRFAFQDFREYQGRYGSWPYPTLTAGTSDYLLAGPGKHGAAIPAGTADGAIVKLRGALASNGENRILELMPGSFGLAGGTAPVAPREFIRRGHVSLSGEIVDTKCHFGVMNPGKGKVHRDCAVRCISGGVPPGLLVRDGSGIARVVLLSLRGGPILDRVAEPVTVSGTLARAGSTWVLETTPDAIRRE